MKLNLDKRAADLLVDAIDILSPDTPKQSDAAEALSARLSKLAETLSDGQQEISFSREEIELIHDGCQTLDAGSNIDSQQLASELEIETSYLLSADADAAFTV